MRQRQFDPICTDCGIKARAHSQAHKDSKEPCDESPDGLHTWTSDRFRAMEAEAIRVDNAEADQRSASTIAIFCETHKAAGKMLSRARHRSFSRATIEVTPESFIIVISK